MVSPYRSSGWWFKEGRETFLSFLSLVDSKNSVSDIPWGDCIQRLTIKNYILIPLLSFKTNKRKAVSENRKLYFYDLGIRNVLVKDFRELDLRPDKGGVFENFIIAEIEKKRKNNNVKQNMYFYREYGGQEIDLVLEDYKKEYICIEMKINKKGGNKDIFPLPHTFTTINSNNYFQEIANLFEDYTNNEDGKYV